MFEESCIWNHQCHLPVALTDTFIERLASQTGPTFHLICHFPRSAFTVVAFCSCTNKNGSDTVAFDVIIDTVTGRYREKLHTGISPYGAIVFSILGPYTGLFYIEV